MSTTSDRPATLTVVTDGDDLAARVARIEAVLFGVERWLGVGEAADRLGVSRWAIHRAIKSGEAPARKHRERWEIDPVWVATQAKTSPRKD